MASNGVARQRHPSPHPEEMRITFFPTTTVGYVDYPQALFTRGLASGLAGLGAEVRIVEERRNAAVRQTLEQAGSSAFRQIHAQFPSLDVHSYEPRSGAPLMEWISRELALITVAVAVEGLPDELCRMIANLHNEVLTRVYVTFQPEDLTDERAEQLELHRFDIVASTDEPAAAIPWTPISPTLAPADATLIEHVPARLREHLITPDTGARQFLQIIAASAEDL